ncbi:MAG: hypothetical protein R3E89_13790 [Thiolinea sp.]
MKFFKPLLALSVAVALSSGAAFAEDKKPTTKLRIQTHYAPETPSGKLAQEYFDDVKVMSNGEIEG